MSDDTLRWTWATVWSERDRLLDSAAFVRAHAAHPHAHPEARARAARMEEQAQQLPAVCGAVVAALERN